MPSAATEFPSTLSRRRPTGPVWRRGLGEGAPAGEQGLLHTRLPGFASAETLPPQPGPLPQQPESKTLWPVYPATRDSNLGNYTPNFLWNSRVLRAGAVEETGVKEVAWVGGFSGREPGDCEEWGIGGA